MPVDDHELFERLKRRDNRAYLQLFDTHFKRLHRLAASLVGDAEQANDIVQSVFISLHETAHRLAPGTCLAAWLVTATRNRALNHLRALRVEIRDRAAYLSLYEEADLLEYLDDETLLRRLHAAITRLPGRCRQVCEMRFRDNLKIDEIARRLGLSENTVKVQIHRGTRRLREDIADDRALSLLLLLLTRPLP
jgi:RNA polymerase sigma-70 factor (ECF subfamily)